MVRFLKPPSHCLFISLSLFLPLIRSLFLSPSLSCSLSPPPPLSLPPSPPPEDRKSALKGLVDSIPASRDELFRYPVPWDVVDVTFVDKRIRPWVTGRVTAFIGEEEKTLITFVCGKIAARASPE